MKIIKKKLPIIYIILFIIFLFFFSINILQNIGDVFWNYGFSHAIRIGEIPYKDFNIVSTPLYSFIMSIGLFIYDDFLTITIEAVIINIFILFILYKLFKNKLLYTIPIFIISLIIKTFIPTYNLLLVLLILLLLLFEKNNKSDISIGIIIGLIIISKHTIGLVITIISLLLVIKNKNKLHKRFLGLIIPCTIFLIYLLLTNSISQFINLCILGMFSFAKNNTFFNIYDLILTLIIFITNLLLLIENRDNNPKELFYSLGCISFIIPIIDQYHTQLYVFTSLICILSYILDNKIIIESNIKKYIQYFFISLNIILLISCYLLLNNIYNNVERLNIPHFKYTNMNKEKINYTREIYNKYNEYDKVLMIGGLSTIMDISSDNEITYFNVLLYGNWGYNIDKTVMNKFDKIHNTYLFVEKKELSNNNGNQDYLYLFEYVEKNYKMIDSIYDYNIYYKE